MNVKIVRKLTTLATTSLSDYFRNRAVDAMARERLSALIGHLNGADLALIRGRARCAMAANGAPTRGRDPGRGWG